MKTISEYLDDVAATTETGTPYATAKALGLSQNYLVNYETGTLPDDYICVLIAERLGLDPLEVIAAANAERERKLKKVNRVQKWEEIWRRVRRAGAVAGLGTIMVGSLLSYPTVSKAEAYAAAADGLYILRIARCG